MIKQKFVFEDSIHTFETHDNWQLSCVEVLRDGLILGYSVQMNECVILINLCIDFNGFSIYNPNSTMDTSNNSSLLLSDILEVSGDIRFILRNHKCIDNPNRIVSEEG